MAIIRELKWGDAGTDVKELQTMLGMLGFDLGASGPDGDFGPDTTAAVSAFQDGFGLEMTGTANAATVNKLYSLMKELGAGSMSTTATGTKKAIIPGSAVTSARVPAMTLSGGVDWTLIGIVAAVVIAFIFFQDEK